MVWRLTGRGEAALVDLWADPCDETAARALVAGALGAARDSGVEVVRCWSLPGPFHGLLRSERSGRRHFQSQRRALEFRSARWRQQRPAT